MTARHRQGFTAATHIERAIAYLVVIGLGATATRAAITILVDGIAWHTTIALCVAGIPAWMILDGLIMTAPANC